MSAPGPESIPTSADPRSKRPLKKKRALSPTSVQAASLSSLFKKPDQEIRLPPPLPSTSSSPPSTNPTTQQNRGAPPDIVTNVQGSSAGAGSGEFHVYKAARRREYERLRLMDEEMKKEKERDEFERKKREMEARDADKTKKNREKREKKLRARQKAKESKGEAEGTGSGGDAPGGGVVARDVTMTEGEDNKADGAPHSSGHGQQPAVSASNGSAQMGLLIHEDDD